MLYMKDISAFEKILIMSARASASVPFVFPHLCHWTLELTHLCNVGEPRVLLLLIVAQHTVAPVAVQEHC